MPTLAAAKQRSAALHTRSLLVDTEMTRDKGSEPPLRLALHETGTGKHDRVMVLLHGLLADSQTWRYLTGELGGQYDLIAVDLPGCGGSDCPDPDQCPNHAFSPESMAREVLTAVRQRLAARGDKAPITIVAHSFGAMILARTFADDALREDFADVLSRIDSTVLFAPPDPAGVRDDGVFRKVADSDDLELKLAARLGILHERIAAASLESAADPRLVTREEVDRIVEVLRDPPHLRVQRAMISQALPTIAPWKRDWPQVRQMEQRYGRLSVPTLIVWGERDEMLPDAMGYKLLDLLPDARLRIVSGGGHCLAVEHPQMCGEVIRQFVATRGSHWPRVAHIDVAATQLTAAGTLLDAASPVPANARSRPASADLSDGR